MTIWNEFYLINSCVRFPIDSLILLPLLLAILDLTTCYHVQSSTSVESITKLIIFRLMFVCARAIVYGASKNASLFVFF